MARRPPSLAVRIIAGVSAFLLLIGLVLALVVPSTGTDSATTTTQPAPVTTAAPVTVPDDDFERIAADIGSLTVQAGTDRCALIDAFSAFNQLPAPANEAQIRAAIPLTAQLLRAIAASATPEEAEQATAIAAGADALVAEAEAEGYDPEWLNTPPGNQALAGEAFVTAIATYQSRTEAECADTTGTPAPDEP